MKKGKPFFMAFLTVLILLFFSCSPSNSEETDTGIYLASPGIPRPEFTAGELSRIDEIRNEGGLIIGTSLWPGVYEQSENGTISGFHSDLVEAVAAFLSLHVEYSIIEFDDFFSGDGVLPENLESADGPAYTPDIFHKAHFLAFDLAPLEWRTRLMDFTTVLPARKIVVTPVLQPILQLGDLAGKTGIVYEKTSYLMLLRDMNTNLNLGIDIRSIPTTEKDMEMLLSGQGDFCVRNSSFILSEIHKFENLDVSMSIGNPSKNGWAFAKDDPDLRHAVAKVLDYFHDTGTFDEIFYANFGIRLDEYYSLIHYDIDREFSLNVQEEAFLENLREDGGLKVAIYDEQSVYEYDSQGLRYGLHYNLIIAIGELLDLPVVLEPVKFSEFFMKNGTVDSRLMSDPNFSYRPDLLDNTDLYVATMTVLPWREKFLSFIEIYPTRMVYVYKVDDPRPDPGNMAGKTISLMANSSYETWARATLPLDKMEVLIGSDGLEQTRLVAEGSANFSLLDANIALIRLKQFPDLTFYPASDKVDSLGWAVSPDNSILREIVEKSIAHLKGEQTFDFVWEAYYGITFDEYLRLLSIEG